MEGLPSPILPLYSPFKTNREETVDYGQVPNCNILAFTKNKRELIPKELRSTMLENSIPEETSDDTERKGVELSINEQNDIESNINERRKKDIEPSIKDQGENDIEPRINELRKNGIEEWISDQKENMEYVTCLETSNEHEVTDEIMSDNENVENETNMLKVHEGSNEWGLLEVIDENSSENEEDIVCGLPHNELEHHGVIICETSSENDELISNKSGTINENEKTRNETGNENASWRQNLIEKYTTEKDLTKVVGNSESPVRTNDIKTFVKENLNNSQECSNYTKYSNKLAEFSTKGENNVLKYSDIPEDSTKLKFLMKTEHFIDLQEYSNSAEDWTKLENFSKKTKDIKEVANEDLEKLEEFTKKTEFLKESSIMYNLNQDFTAFEKFSRRTKDMNELEIVEKSQDKKSTTNDFNAEIKKLEPSNINEKHKKTEYISIKSDEINGEGETANKNEKIVDRKKMFDNSGNVSIITEMLNEREEMSKLTNVDELFMESNNFFDQTEELNEADMQNGENFVSVVDLDETKEILEENSNEIEKINPIEQNLCEIDLPNDIKKITDKNRTVKSQNDENEGVNHSGLDNKDILAGKEATQDSNNIERDNIEEEQSNKSSELEQVQTNQDKSSTIVPEMIEKTKKLSLNGKACPSETIPHKEEDGISQKSPKLTQESSNKSNNSSCSGDSKATIKSFKSMETNQLVLSSSQICTVSPYISPTKCHQDCTQCVNVREVIDLFEGLYKKNLNDAEYYKTPLTFTKRSGNDLCKKYKHILSEMNSKLKELDTEFSQTEENAAFHQYREPSGDYPTGSHHILSEKLQKCLNEFNESFCKTDSVDNDEENCKIDELIQGFNCLKLREESPIVLCEPTITVLDNVNNKMKNSNLSEINVMDNKLAKQKSAKPILKKKSNNVLEPTKRNKNQRQTINNNLQIISHAKNNTNEILSHDMNAKSTLSVNKVTSSLYVNLNRSLLTPENELNNSQNLLVLPTKDIRKKNAKFDCNYSKPGNHYMDKPNNIDVYSDRKVTKNKVDHQLASTSNEKCVQLSKTLALNDGMRPTRNLDQSCSLFVNNRSYSSKPSACNGPTFTITIGSTICSFTLQMIRLFVSLFILIGLIIIALVLYQRFRRTCPSCTQFLTFLGDLLAMKLEHLDGPPPI